MSLPCADGSVRPWELVNPFDGRTMFRGRSRQEAEDYLEESGRDDWDLYRDGVLVRSGMDLETVPCDGPSDADPGL